MNRSSCPLVGFVSSCSCRAWSWAGDGGSGLIGASNAEEGLGIGRAIERELVVVAEQGCGKLGLQVGLAEWGGGGGAALMERVLVVDVVQR